MRPPHLGDPKALKPLIDALQKQKRIQLVSFLSMLGVEKNPIPPHHKIEQYIEQAGLPYCHIRPGFFMQNISGVHAFEIQHFNRIVVPVRNALTSFIDAQDIGELTARVLCEAHMHQNTSYSITGAEAIEIIGKWLKFYRRSWEGTLCMRIQSRHLQKITGSAFGGWRRSIVRLWGCFI